MQDRNGRRSNADRTQTMRDGLIASARELFIEKGYAETSTPEIVARANVTRGALYHHFEDKASLFRAVIAAESERVAEAINVATQDCSDAAEALDRGTDAYLDAMTVSGRTRLLLIDGPSALGREAMDAIDRQTSGGTMLVGLSAALERPADAAMRAHASLLSAAFDRAALDINAGGDAVLYRAILKRMLSEAVGANRA